MRLFIRSQDKTELVKVEGIKYEKVPVGHSILVPCEFGVYNVGQYESKERALEVLDEIQNIIIMQQLLEMDSHKFFQSMPKDTKNIKIVLDSMSVYEMPQR